MLKSQKKIDSFDHEYFVYKVTELNVIALIIVKISSWENLLTKAWWRYKI